MRGESMKKRKKSGNASIMLCIIIITGMCFAAYSLDIGIVYVERVRLHNALDAAVLAGGLELPGSESKARQIAEEYLIKNGIDPLTVTINISSDKKGMEIVGSKDVKHLFAPIFGINDSIVRANTKAMIAPVRAVKGGIRPFAVEAFDYVYGDRVTLKEGAGDGYHGNYSAVALGGTGASIFRDNALHGFSGNIEIGDYIPTETGNMAGATNDIKNYINSENSSFNNFQRDSKRLWTIPLVNTLMVDGRKEVQVMAFGQFFVESVEQRSGKIEITGRFIRYVVKGEIDTQIADTGVYGLKLTK
jgi:Flp pilus assembly protein TadG